MLSGFWRTRWERGSTTALKELGSSSILLASFLTVASSLGRFLSVRISVMARLRHASFQRVQDL